MDFNRRAGQVTLYVRKDDEALWQTLEQEAAARDTSLSALVAEIIREWLEGHTEKR